MPGEGPVDVQGDGHEHQEAVRHQEVPVDQGHVAWPPPVPDGVTEGGEVGEECEEEDHTDDDGVDDVRDPPVLLQHEAMRRVMRGGWRNSIPLETLQDPPLIQCETARIHV